MTQLRSLSVFSTPLLLALVACADQDAAPFTQATFGSLQSAISVDAGADASPPSGAPFETFAFTSTVSTSGLFSDGDVRLEAIRIGEQTLARDRLQTVASARILIDDGVDAVRGGNNFASGQGINSVVDTWEAEGPATITPTGVDLAASLGNFNLTSIVVTREAVGTASLEVSFADPTDTLFFWERGSAASATTANSDLVVETLDEAGNVSGAYQLLRSEYAPTGIEITTWNGSFLSPSVPGGAFPQLGSVGLLLATPTTRLRLTSVQEAEGGRRDDGPDYKLVATKLGPKPDAGEPDAGEPETGPERR